MIELVLSDKKVERMIGWGIITESFPDVIANIDFDITAPSEEAYEYIRSLRNTL